MLHMHTCLYVIEKYDDLHFFYVLLGFVLEHSNNSSTVSTVEVEVGKH